MAVETPPAVTRASATVVASRASPNPSQTAGQAMDVFDVLAAQDRHERRGRNHAQEPARGVHHRNRRQPVPERVRGDALLVEVGAHGVRRMSEGAERRGRRCGQQRGDGDRTAHPAVVVDHVDHVGESRRRRAQPRHDLSRGVGRVRGGDALDQVRVAAAPGAGGFGAHGVAAGDR
jgi:hypothetical protein